jgi:hypothetical protein
VPDSIQSVKHFASVKMALCADCIQRALLSSLVDPAASVLDVYKNARY